MVGLTIVWVTGYRKGSMILSTAVGMVAGGGRQVVGIVED